MELNPCTVFEIKRLETGEYILPENQKRIDLGGRSDPNALRLEKKVQPIMDQLKSLADRFYVVSWKGGKNPTGARIGDHRIVNAQHGILRSALYDIGYYDRIIEFGGEDQKEQQLLAYFHEPEVSIYEEESGDPLATLKRRVTDKALEDLRVDSFYYHFQRKPGVQSNSLIGGSLVYSHEDGSTYLIKFTRNSRDYMKYSLALAIGGLSFEGPDLVPPKWNLKLDVNKGVKKTKRNRMIDYRIDDYFEGQHGKELASDEHRSFLEKLLDCETSVDATTKLWNFYFPGQEELLKWRLFRHSGMSF